MKTSYNVFIGTLLGFVGSEMQQRNASFQSVVTTCDSSDEKLREYFRARCIDDSDVNDQNIAGSLNFMGINDRALRSFSEMLTVVKQHADGLVTDAELLLALQCTSLQIQNLITHSRLPAKMAEKVSVTDWDDGVRMLSPRVLGRESQV